jgi:hypothetical protein
MAKDRLPDPSEISAIEFKRESRRFEISLVSVTISIDWSILRFSGKHRRHWTDPEKTVSPDDNL